MQPACPHCKHALTDAEVKRIWAQHCRSLHPGYQPGSRAGKGGRPRIAERCACGRFTLATARKRGHRCEREV